VISGRAASIIWVDLAIHSVRALISRKGTVVRVDVSWLREGEVNCNCDKSENEELFRGLHTSPLVLVVEESRSSLGEVLGILEDLILVESAKENAYASTVLSLGSIKGSQKFL